MFCERFKHRNLKNYWSIIQIGFIHLSPKKLQIRFDLKIIKRKKKANKQWINCKGGGRSNDDGNEVCNDFYSFYFGVWNTYIHYFIFFVVDGIDII